MEDSSKEPFLKPKYVQDGSVDFNGNPAIASRTGCYKGGIPLLIYSVFTSISLNAIIYNFVIYMVSELGFSNAAAASHANIWTFAQNFTPLLGAYIADRHIGRFRTMVVFSFVFTAGFVALAVTSYIRPPSKLAFFMSLYLVALGKCLAPGFFAFGADQFDGSDPLEAVQRSSYFFWKFCSTCVGMLIAVLGLVYVGDRYGFAASMVLSALAMFVGLAVVLSAVKLYRYKPAGIDKTTKYSLYAIQTQVILVWLGSILYESMKSQTFSLFVEQAALMETSAFWGKIQVPAASMNCFDPISVIVCTIVYDRVAVARSRGLTFKQRMGTGLAMVAAAMVYAAGLERWRRTAALGSGFLVNVVWQVPQYTLVGASKVFYHVGLLEFFYEKVPDNMKSLGTSLTFLSTALGGLLSALLVFLASSLTGEESGWIPRDLDHGHLDNFFWMLSAFGGLHLVVFMVFSRSGLMS